MHPAIRVDLDVVNDHGAGGDVFLMHDDEIMVSAALQRPDIVFEPLVHLPRGRLNLDRVRVLFALAARAWPRTTVIYASVGH